MSHTELDSHDFSVTTRSQARDARTIHTGRPRALACELTAFDAHSLYPSAVRVLPPLTWLDNLSDSSDVLQGFWQISTSSCTDGEIVSWRCRQRCCDTFDKESLPIVDPG